MKTATRQQSSLKDMQMVHKALGLLVAIWSKLLSITCFDLSKVDTLFFRKELECFEDVSVSCYEKNSVHLQQLTVRR